MSKRLFSMVGGLALTLGIGGSALAQDSQTKTIVTTQTTKSLQHADGSWTVIEYPADKEVIISLNPSNVTTSAQGTARVMRMGGQTAINLNLSGLTDVTGLNLYAVDPWNKVTLLGPVAVSNGIATQAFTTPLDRFMLVLSPEANLTAIGPNTMVAFRSLVPQGFAVVPVSFSGPKDGMPIGDKVSAVSTAGATAAYNVPMLGIPSFRVDKHTKIKVHFSGELRGAHANAFIKPLPSGVTQLKMRFHELKTVPVNTRLVAWTVSPDNNYVRLGLIVNGGLRNEAEVVGETAMRDFGLFVTVENADESPAPTGAIIGTITR